MKKLSKVLSVICALVLVAGLGVTAFAAGTTADPTGVNIRSTEGPNNVKDDLIVEVQAALAEPLPEYSVNVAWESLVLIYSGNTAPSSWNFETHEYDTPGADGKWAHDSANITITNNSNVGVTATTTYESTTGYEDGQANASSGVTVDVSGASFETPAQLAAGTPTNKPNGVDTDNQAVVTVTASGTPKETMEVDAGTITVAITAAAAA